MISGCQSLWHIKHLHNSANVAFNLSVAERPLCHCTPWKITTGRYLSLRCLQDGQSFIKLKNWLWWSKKKKKGKKCVPWSQAVKSQPCAAQIPVIPLTLTLMCFSLDRPAWNTGRVTWHYKRLFIKLSLQVILLRSCVFVRSFSLFHIFQRYGKCHYFRHVYVFYVLCQQSKLLLTLLGVVQTCTPHRHRGSSQFMLPVNDSFQDNLV